jgi:hypothetical protein
MADLVLVTAMWVPVSVLSGVSVATLVLESGVGVAAAAASCVSESDV